MIRSARLLAVFCFTAMLLSLHSAPARAEVTESGEAGFVTRNSVTIAGPRAAVYAAAVRQVGSWWSSDHTVSGRAANLYIEPEAKGCFCERLGDSGGVVHLTVTFVNPTVMLRLSGGLGPLGLMGAYGNMTWEFSDDEEGTAVTWTYAVGGYAPDGLQRIAGAVDAVLNQQLQSLKAFAENQ